MKIKAGAVRLGDLDDVHVFYMLCYQKKKSFRRASAQLKNGRDPALDNTSAEILKLGGDVSFKWLRHALIKPGKKSLSFRTERSIYLTIHFLRRVIVLSVATTVASLALYPKVFVKAILIKPPQILGSIILLYKI